ncbi:Dihydroanticapsin 7-dehydrogenase [Lentilactobacillus hilgardii]|uniref:SDR family NAD(P)-dependent oxidoreductase n=1 Tax=Lentilactobacillus hilgardii TaxID=1588 RepID=UPI00019C4B21|nr:SDR family oxidoreductase [Lentilactobacillus hilgardii]EEI20222.1 oxidoreductase, short chain dehydrogenase/reductase family protein [Lentilactobacillus buchneri ATCC 11577]MCT3396326.1 SDR family oxidoreductase [Lentilactobacillus hilgardii]QIR08708.1 Dihydroanticapsin 7-dehydrogenase [Lentilactobacillus hilgardii]
MTKTVVITGGVSGMGLSASKLFLSKGWNVMMADFNEKLGEKVNKELSSKYSSKQVAFQQTDVSNAVSVNDLKVKTDQLFGQVDSVINNAGIFTKGALHEVTEDAWDRIMAVDVKSIYLMTKAFVPEMMKQKSGTIVNTASISGLTGDYNMAAYNAAKGAVVNLVRAMALDYGKFGIRVNNVNPGPTMTPMFEANPQSVIDTFKKASPLGKLATSDDIARVMYFLATDESSPITGENVPVSAGFEIYSGQPVQK